MKIERANYRVVKTLSPREGLNKCMLLA